MRGCLSACLRCALSALLVSVVLSAQAVTIEPDGKEPAPQKKIDTDTKMTLASVGLGVGQAFIPGGAVIAVAWSAVGPLSDALGSSIEHRDQLERSNLKVIDARIQRLHEMQAEGRDLGTDPEAQQLLKEFKASADDTYNGRTGGLQFAAKSVFSAYGGMTFAGHTAEWLFSRWLGSRVSEWLDLDEPTKVTWKRQGVLRNVFTKTQWRSLRKVAQLGGDLQNSILRSLLRKLLSKLLSQSADEVLDKKIDEILARHQELEQDLSGGYSGGGGGSYMDLRVDALNIPDLYFPVLAAAPEPVAQAPAPMAVVPAALAVAADPVVAPISVQTQVIISQPTTYRGGDRYEPPPRREDPPPPPPEEPPPREDPPEPPHHDPPPFKPPCSSSFDGNTFSRVCGG